MGRRVMAYFFDSSVIIGLINESEKYLKFKEEKIITNALNLAEVHNFFLREHNEQTADYWVDNLDFYFLEITPQIAIDASKFKHKNKKENLSYADCIGYMTSLKNGLIFLTGDSKFKSKENVEFVK